MPNQYAVASYWAALIKGLRNSQHLSQCQLAEVLGVDQASVSRWERGLTEPRYAQRKALDTMAKDAGLATLGDLVTVVTASPFPMILVDRRQVVLAASPCSGFEPDRSVFEQTPSEEWTALVEFSNQLEATGFWAGSCPQLDYAFQVEGETRRAVVVAVTIRGQVFALVQKAW